MAVSRLVDKPIESGCIYRKHDIALGTRDRRFFLHRVGICHHSSYSWCYAARQVGGLKYNINNVLVPLFTQPLKKNPSVFNPQEITQTYFRINSNSFWNTNKTDRSFEEVVVEVISK